MNITIHFGSWLVPTLITLVAIIGGIIVAAWDGKSGGDYSLPIFGFIAVLGAVLVSITAWAVFFALWILG